MNINSSQPINSNQLHPFQGPEGRKDEFQEEVYGCEACSSSARYGSRTRPLRNLKANKTRPYQGCVSLCCCPLPLQSPEAVLHSRTAEISAMFNHSQDLESISCRFIYLFIFPRHVSRSRHQSHFNLCVCASATFDSRERAEGARQSTGFLGRCFTFLHPQLW